MIEDIEIKKQEEERIIQEKVKMEEELDVKKE